MGKFKTWEELTVTQQYIVISLILILFVAIGYLFGYKKGVNITETFYIEQMKEKCLSYLPIV